jgi:hypothetical protein
MKKRVRWKYCKNFYKLKFSCKKKWDSLVYIDIYIYIYIKALIRDETNGCDWVKYHLMIYNSSLLIYLFIKNKYYHFVNKSWSSLFEHYYIIGNDYPPLSSLKSNRHPDE